MKKILSILTLMLGVIGFSSFGLSNASTNLSITSDDYQGHYAEDGWCERGGSGCSVVELPTAIVIVKK